MSQETFYCTVEVRAASWYVDPSPAEFCENEVAAEGLACNAHDDVDDDYAYEEYKEAQRESRYAE